MLRPFLILSLGFGLAACGAGAVSSGDDADDASDADDADDACQRPDVLVVLDRTMSMAQRPDGSDPVDTPAGHAASKWAIAIDAIERLTAELEPTIRFGLILFPLDPGADACRTIDQILAGDEADNPRCEVGEVLVTPGAPDAAATIDAMLDPETTSMCQSTPIGGGLVAARDALADLREAGRGQHVVLIGDGRDTCDEAAALAAADALAGDGVTVHAVGFDASGGHIDAGMLNDLACAGRSAPGFPAGCTADAAGRYRAVDRAGRRLFRVSTDAASLAAELGAVAGDVCCGCLVE
jgi:hypothetical protein